MDYPPFTSVEDMPLHGGGESFDDDFWFACENPERPRDEFTLYDWRCRGCALAAEAHVAVQGDVDLFWYPRAGEEPILTSINWQIQRAYYNGVLP